MMLNNIKSLLILGLLIGVVSLQSITLVSAKGLKNLNVLVYTKNGEGYVHDNIPFAVKSFQKLGEEHKFKVTVSDDPALFTEENLKQFNILVFTSTNNDVFDTDEQRLAFRRYVQAGGGFVGIHSVMGTERNWDWFKQLVGGTFLWHDKFQNYQIKVIDPAHPTVEGLPLVWEKEDECYFMKEVYPGIKVTMAHDLKSLNPANKEKVDASAASYASLYPAVWHHNFDGGHVWVTSL